MTELEKDRISAAFHQLRPDWPARSIRTLLDRPALTDRARRDVIVALGWVCAEPQSATPARVLENGPWWKAAGVTGEVTKRHATPASACKTCGRDYGDDCCDQPTLRPAPTTDVTAAANQARRLLHPTPTEETPC